jgi:hypothetical protein
MGSLLSEPILYIKRICIGKYHTNFKKAAGKISRRCLIMYIRR